MIIIQTLVNSRFHYIFFSHSLKTIVFSSWATYQRDFMFSRKSLRKWVLNLVGVFTGPKCEIYLDQYIHRAEESIALGADRVTQLVARCGWPDALTQLADSQSSTPSQQSKTNSTSVLDTPEETWLFNLVESSILKKRRALHLQRTPNPQHLSKNGVSTTYYFTAFCQAFVVLSLAFYFLGVLLLFNCC